MIEFSGSYNGNDVKFLLSLKNDINTISIEEKEEKIQQGVNYGALLSEELPPTDYYVAMFRNILKFNSLKLANHILAISQKINLSKNNNNIILISLARAGTPIGVLIKKTLSDLFNINTYHYSLSIIKGIGLDYKALSYILNKHPQISSNNIFFIDGWASKGSISQTLSLSIDTFNKNHNTNLNKNLYVISDLHNLSYFSATNEDYLIPSALLNSTISGLISRTFYIDEDSFHGCKYYSNFSSIDCSNFFISYVFNIINKLKTQNIILKNTEQVLSIRKKFLQNNNSSFIKYGIAESTRVFLRRVPEKLIIQSAEDLDVQHLIYLANLKNIPIEINSSLPYKTISYIINEKED